MTLRASGLFRIPVTIAVVIVVFAVMMVGAASAFAAAAAVPAWTIQSFATPTTFTPGDESGRDGYRVEITNSGGASTDGTPITITDTLPAGLTVQKIELAAPRGSISLAACSTQQSGGVSTVSCEVTEALSRPARLNPGDQFGLEIHVKTPLSASGPLTNQVSVHGGGAASGSWEAMNQASAVNAPAGFQEFRAQLLGADGLPATGATAHPYEYVTSFAVNTVSTEPGSHSPFVPAGGDLREVEVALPPGLAANPTTVERCTAQQFIHVIVRESTLHGTNFFTNECPAGSAVGLVAVQQLEGPLSLVAPLYNLVPPKGMPAQLGFTVIGQPVYINTKVRSDGDYGVTAYVKNTTEAKRVTAARVTVWGTPGDASHDTMRAQCAELEGTCPVAGTPRAFMRLPSQCADPLVSTFSFDTWAQPPAVASASSGEAAPTECAAAPFTPTVEAKPSSTVGDSPSGLRFDLHLPQKEHEEPEGLGEADLRDVSVMLPPGLVANPSQADGLAACSPAQVGLTTPVGQSSPIHFNLSPAKCPDASKLGTVEAVVPALDHPLKGSVYLAAQEDNPFNSLLAFYIVLEDEQTGIVVKLAAKISPDPVTGQLTTMVQDAPQVPVEDFKFDFFEGSRAPLRTPATCGTDTTTSVLTPWSAPEGLSVTPSDASQIVSAPGGGSCPSTPAQEPNAPSFEAGTATPTAGAYSPLVVHLERGDGSQSFSAVSVTLPPGVTGKLAGIPECSEAQIAIAQARSHPGEGAAEQVSPSCPSSSMIGTVTVGAGAGPHPFYVTGKAYLAGPYKGAPFSAVFVTPAIAGPFDLGTVVVRAGLYIDPSTAQVTTKSDPIPSILQGIPLDVRSIVVMVDRSQFILNPTNCNPLTASGEEVSTLNQTAPLSARFQVGACQNLKFTPQFTVSTTGSTSKAKGASLSVKVAYPAGSLGAQANVGRVDLQLPKQLPARLSTLQKACTEAQFNTNPAGCPVASMIGSAKAITPLLSSPLTGPAILVSHGGAAFPDVEFLLQGEGVMVVLDGKTQIKKGITYSHFETVPDQPITLFETTFPEGPYSVLATNLPVSAKNSLCGQALTLPTTLTAQNGAVINQTTKATITGCAKTKTLTRAQKLTKALKVCHKKHGAKRKACERQARKKYGPVENKRKH